MSLLGLGGLFQISSGAFVFGVRLSEARDASLECGGLVRHHGKDIVLNEEIAESAITVRAFSCLDGFRVVVEAPRFTDLKAQLKTMNADPRPRD